MNVEREYLYNRIQYISLRLSIIFTGRGYIAREKESAIRGAIGNALLDVYCSNNDEMNRDCLVCDNRKNCTVQNVLYSPFRIKPDFVTTGESIGYILECNNKKKEFSKGEDLQFNTILFGQCAEYAEILIDAVAKAGEKGLGRDKLKFRLNYVCDRKNRLIYENEKWHRENLTYEYISEYVEERKKELYDRSNINIRFLTPATIKFQKQFISSFIPEAVLESMARRIYMLNCYVGNEIEYPYIMVEDLPEAGKEKSELEEVHRYSERKKSNVILKGLCGSLEMQGVSQWILELILACELTHVGKNTSFGFGKYKVE